MNDELILLKQGKFLEVFRLISDGSTKLDACNSVGIAPKTFDNWLSTQGGKDAMLAWTEINKEAFKTTITKIATAQTEGINKLISQLENTTDPDMIMKLIEFLAKHRAIYEQQAALVAQKGSSDDRASQYLSQKLVGVRLQPGINKITRVTETVEFGNDPPSDFIEAEIKETGE